MKKVILSLALVLSLQSAFPFSIEKRSYEDNISTVINEKVLNSNEVISKAFGEYTASKALVEKSKAFRSAVISSLLGLVGIVVIGDMVYNVFAHHSILPSIK